MSRKSVIYLLAGLAAAAALGTGWFAYRTFASISELFRLNGQLKAQGYYMAEFEFKMLGCAYYLDKGRYIKAISTINRIRDELSSKKGLVKPPEFSNKLEKLDFYLGLQNPRTGAFMDDSYPFFTYSSPTLNMLEYLQQLSLEVNRPLRLKYPLKFLDDIDTPEKLTAFLDDLSTVGRLGARFRTPFVTAAEIPDYYENIERPGFYSFSREWKNTLSRWFYERQDKKTGYWGARWRSGGELLNSGDLLSTEKIIKLYVDAEGNDLQPEFPLRHKEQLFATTLRKLSEPRPEDFDEVHEWNLMMNRGTRLLVRYLWRDASPENKARARELMEKIIRSKFDGFYVESEGAFNLYPGARQADLDGTGETLHFLNLLGVLSGEKQRRLWGPPEKNMADLGARVVSEITEQDLDPITRRPGVNSVRFYLADPVGGDYVANVVGLYYPHKTAVPDILELLPKVLRWLKTTPQNMGNWVAKEAILSDFPTGLESVPATVGKAPLGSVNQALAENGGLVVLGFDLLQTPRCKVTFRRY
ncbi:MAG: hypothetical protein V1816_02435 [Pseudomonadota bacterium]